MKILHISPMYVPALGGAEHHLKAISERLVCRGHQVTVFTSNVTTGWDMSRGCFAGLPQTEVINGVTVKRFHPDGGAWAKVLDQWMRLKGGWRSTNLLFGPDGIEMLLQCPRTFMMIPQILSSKADVVMSMNWDWPPAYHTYLAKRMMRFTLVGIPLFHTAKARCERPVYKKMLASCDAVVVNTNYEAEFVRERGAPRVEVAGVGIEPAAFENRRGDEMRARYGLSRFPVVGFVGRQESTKGVLMLIEAMRIVWQWDKEVRLVLAGPPSPQKEIEIAVEKLSDFQKNRIVHIDAFEEREKGSIFDAFDVFAMPSTEESFGIAYLEAWLCEKPVIGSRIGSTKCVINDGVDGLLVEPDKPDDIARAIIELLSDSEMRERMGKRGHAKTVTQYTWAHVIDKIERLYLDLAAAKAASCHSVPDAKRASR